MNNYQEQLKKEYQQMADAFGIGTSGWNMLYTKFNSSVFCDDNKASIIGQYLTWYDFTKMLRENDIIYYYGIDEFLSAYKDAVQSCLKIELN